MHRHYETSYDKKIKCTTLDLLVSIIEHKKAKNKEYIYCMPILQGNCILSLMSPSYS